MTEPKERFASYVWTAPGEGIEEIILPSKRDGRPTDISSLYDHPYFSSVGSMIEDGKVNMTQPAMLIQMMCNAWGLEGPLTTHEAPPHLKLMRDQQLVAPAEIAEGGHFKWFPRGMIVREAMLAYAARLADEWGAVPMANPSIVRLDNPTIRELLGGFGERVYLVDGQEQGRNNFALRWASDPAGFPFSQSVTYSLNQTPFKIYEEANCWRNEQSGEVGRTLERVRHFLMTDMHAFCADSNQAAAEFEQLSYLFAGLMDNIIAKGKWILAWEGTEDFFMNNHEWLKSISDRMGVPAFFKLTKEMTHYFIMKSEYQGILANGSNLQVSTVQWDIKNGKRFNIGYTDEYGEKHPAEVILHASSFGSIERALCNMLEAYAIEMREGGIPQFPLWLSPSQARIIPVAERHLEYSLDIIREMNRRQIRTDIDDSTKTDGNTLRGLGQRIANAGRDWVPYIIVVGDKEVNGEGINLSRRETPQNYKVIQQYGDLSQLIKEIRFDIKDLPYVPLPKALQRISTTPYFS